MNPQERRMLAFSLLARESRIRRQAHGELRFLLLAGRAACESGWAGVPQRCLDRIRQINPHHLATRYDSFEAALRDEDFRTFLQRLDRFCTFELAEALLEKLEPDWQTQSVAHDQDLGSRCLDLLADPAEH